MLLLRDPWQSLDTFLVVTTEREAAQHVLQDCSKNKELSSQNITSAKAKRSALGRERFFADVCRDIMAGGRQPFMQGLPQSSREKGLRV